MAVAPFAARLSLDRSTVTMKGELWKHTIPVQELARWLKFYRTLRERKNRKYAAFYAEPVAALERIERELKASSA